MSRRSFIGSIHDKLSRKGSTSSKTSSHSNMAEPPKPSPSNFRGPAELSAGNSPQAASSPSSPVGFSFNSNPFSNPSPATRRPRHEPPPAYSESPTDASGPTLPPESPSYTPRETSPAPSASSTISAASLSTPEDPYAFLSVFDTVFLIDDSGSMAGRSWREVRKALQAITPICTAHDSDGVDLYFLNHRSGEAANPAEGAAAGGYRNVTTAAQVERIFNTVRPGGGTPTGQRLHQILKPYVRYYEQGYKSRGSDPEDSGVKPLNMIVITDGAASDDPETVLINIASRLDTYDAPPYQIGVQFFQVGNEPGAAQALRDLDDNLAKMAGHYLRDIVDTVTWDAGSGSSQELTADGILKTVLGAVVKRLDRQPRGGVADAAAQAEGADTHRRAGRTRGGHLAP